MGNSSKTCTIDFDEYYADWINAFENMLLIAFLGDVNFSCLITSSQAHFAWGLMFLFVFLTLIMLLNLLIALMAKSFDNIYETQHFHFLYLSSRQASLWEVYPASPPPFNLLSLPYLLIASVSACIV